ncbi:MAG: DUF1214 domain-containing protein [Anaerolineae bacterium]|jgi:hypothetical protein
MMRWRIIIGLVLGIVVGGILAVLTAGVLMSTKATAVNRWITIYGCGMSGNGVLLRAACAEVLPAVNVPQEAVYWRTTTDGAGQKLSGQHDYILHFPPGGLPPNNAFWSLTMGDAKNHFVPNPINRYSVGDRSGLVPNADGSVDIYIQETAPAGHESNWLPAPAGNFTLWLRAYLPGAAILDGTYQVPPVQEVQ